MATSGTRNTVIAFDNYEIAVSLKKASTSRDIKTEYVNKDGQKVTMSGGGAGSRTPAPGIEKAVRIAGDVVVRLPVEELKAIEDASKQAWGKMLVLETIDYRQVPTERIVGSYWLQPHAGTARGLRLLAEGLRASGRVAIVKWVSGSREKLGVIRVRTPERDRIALLLSELTFANDFTDADDDALAINEAEVTPDAIEKATRLVKAFARSGEAKLEQATDGAVDARLALVEKLQNEQLDDQLERSVGEQETEAATAS